LYILKSILECDGKGSPKCYQDARRRRFPLCQISQFGLLGQAGPLRRGKAASPCVRKPRGLPSAAALPKKAARWSTQNFPPDFFTPSDGRLGVFRCCPSLWFKMGGMCDRDNVIAGVQEGYDRWAEVYDRDGNPLQALEQPHFQRLIGPVRGLKILDLGCGTGRHSLWLASQGAIVTALDFSEGMLNEARRKPGAAKVRFMHFNLQAPLPFESGSFDRVVSGLVLEHIDDLAGFFGEAYRVLATGGFAVISAMHPAMMLRGTQAQFKDPGSGEVVRPGSLPHQLSDFIMSALDAGFSLEHFVEDAADAELATRFPRAEKYLGWPMLAIFRVAKEQPRAK